MAKLEIHETLAVDKSRLFQIIVGYEEYPSFVYGVKSVQVERNETGKARVTYRLSIMKDLAYTLDVLEDKKLGTVKWSLVESNFLKANHGTWAVKEYTPGKCEVRYVLELEFKIFIPTFVIKRLLKKRLSSIVKSIEERAQKISTSQS